MTAKATDGFPAIWKTLRGVKIDTYVEEKGGLSYLAWGHAWELLMQHYPAADYHFEPTHYEPNGTATVECTIRIGDCERSMWLPVMDFNNNAIPEPSSKDINDARMRCLVKCVAMFGLGFGLYSQVPKPRGPVKRVPAREEPPRAGTVKRKPAGSPTEEKRKAFFAVLGKMTDSDEEKAEATDLIKKALKVDTLSDASDEVFSQALKLAEGYPDSIKGSFDNE